MKSWKNLTADVNMWMNKHFTPGRTAKINKIVVHHNAGRLSVQGCWNSWQTRAASAHYQVEHGGRIGQLVHDYDTAWHASGANANGIGIEHANEKFSPDWTISPAALENGAHLIAALCVAYKLGRPKWRKNVFPHYDFNATACPGDIADGQRVKYMRRAEYWYDQMVADARKPSTPAKKPVKYTDVKALQKAVRAVADNVVGPDTLKRVDAVRKASGWGGRKFPYGVAFTQRVVGTIADGWWGRNSNAAHDKTVAAIQKAVGAKPSGVWDDKTESLVRKMLSGAEKP